MVTINIYVHMTVIICIFFFISFRQVLSKCFYNEHLLTGLKTNYNLDNI